MVKRAQAKAPAPAKAEGRPITYVLIGVHGSGKSEFAKRTAAHFLRIGAGCSVIGQTPGSDREALAKQARAAAERGSHVVWDSENLTVEERKWKVAATPGNDIVACVFYPPETRADHKRRLAAAGRMVSDKELKAMLETQARELPSVGGSEGYSKVIVFPPAT